MCVCVCELNNTHTHTYSPSPHCSVKHTCIRTYVSEIKQITGASDATAEPAGGLSTGSMAECVCVCVRACTCLCVHGPLSDSHLQHRELISKTRKWHWAAIGPQHLLHSPSWETGRGRVCVCVCQRTAVQQAGTGGAQLPALGCGAQPLQTDTDEYTHVHTYTFQLSLMS